MWQTGKRQNRGFGKLSPLAGTIKDHKALCMLYIMISLMLSFLPMLSVNFRMKFVDGVLSMQSDSRLIIILLIINLLLIYLSKYGLPVIASLLDNLLSEKIQLSTEYNINKKKASIPFYHYEVSEAYDKIELTKEAPEQIWLFFKGVINIITNLISIVSVFFMLFQVGSSANFVLLLMFIPVFLFSIKAGTSYYNTWAKTASMRRYCDYQREVLLDKQYAQEKILFAFTPFFEERWEGEYKKVRQLSIKEELRGSVYMQISGFLFCIYIAALIFLLFTKLMNNEFTLGFVISLISIVPSLFVSVATTISNEINNLVRAKKAIEALDLLYSLEDEEDYISLPEKDMDFSRIEFSNVSFKYPDTERWILKGFEMVIEKGKHYAIVGENGSGKSTIIKLLLRLYKVSEGAILIDGRNINDFSKSELLGLLTALFQDFEKYYTDIAENIGIGDIRRINDLETIVDSAKKAGFHERICKEPLNYQTKLGKMHDNGTEFSGGEWQKLCIARLIMSPCPIKILDEPTAAMDPIFEHELYQKFNEIMKDKTTISISHRLNSCKHSNCIYVIKNGKILESGTHKELMKKKSFYCKMYTTQKNMYI